MIEGLILNGARFLQLLIRVIFATDSLRHNVVIAIQDDGIGISKDDLNRIFDPFYTTKEVGKEPD